MITSFVGRFPAALFAVLVTVLMPAALLAAPGSAAPAPGSTGAHTGAARTALAADDGTVTARIVTFDINGPAVVDVDVIVRNSSDETMRKTRVALRGPVGWQIEPDTQPIGTIRPGRSGVATFSVRVPEARPGFRIRTFTATATYTGGDGAGQVIATRDFRSGDPLADIAAAYDNVGITSESNTAPGAFDSEGNSFSAEKLTAAGAGRNAELTALGATLHMPDTAPGTRDNATGRGQAVELDGTGSKVVLLGSGSGTAATGTLTLYYTDGTSSSASIGFPNWSFQEPGAHGATLVVATKGRNKPSGYGDAAYDYRIFANSAPITPGKTVDFVVLPSNPSVHVFDAAIAP